MNNSNVLIVVGVSDVKTDKNKRNFKTLSLATPDKKEVTIPGGKTVLAKIQPKIGKINVWEENYLNNTADYGYDLKEGDAILGDVVTQKVEAYEIPNPKTGEVYTVNTYSCVVLGDSASASWASAVSKAFTSNDKIIDVNLVSAEEVKEPAYSKA
jgi:hypothetical protein